MKRTLRYFGLACVALSIACSERTPTGPETVTAKGQVAVKGAATAPPRRPGATTVPPRGGSGPVLQGVWGDEEVNLTVGQSGGRFEQYCAVGTIDQPILLDANGRFSVAGTFLRNRGGPTGVHEPARYIGSVDGMGMILTVTLTGSNEQIGPFTLLFGRMTQVRPCPLV